ncbi:hypothetical protein [Bacillus thuringiensis]|uniref:hypothetical protein n=1 Tax=Bacillus thuringiensis TaxID=1428 RepID=UPI000BA22BC1|nr:hypothetical protein [Bacillus thuringiensis]
MDRLETIAVSKIATVISNQTIIKTNEHSKWDRVLSNAGQSSLYSEFSTSLEPYYFNGVFKNENPSFEQFFSSIKTILHKVYQGGDNAEEFTLFLGTIVEEIKIEDLFDDTSLAFLPRKYQRSLDPIGDFFKEKSEEECQDYIIKNAKDDFQLLKNNLNILNLDIFFRKGRLNLKPFTEQSNGVLRNTSILLEWLEGNYPNVAKLYQEAIDNYIAGNSVSCISNCRNIITGFFSHYKDNGNRSWTKGLQNISTDTYIENVTAPNNIAQGRANTKIIFDGPNEFKYPRFSLIYSLYTLTSDLGAHTAESPKIEGVLYPERTTLNDALLSLRMTEDVLIWSKEQLKN